MPNAPQLLARARSLAAALALPLAAPLALCTLAPSAAAAPVSVAQGAADQKPLKDADLGGVAKQFAALFEAYDKNAGAYKVEESLQKELQKAAKKLGGDGKDMEPMLAHPWSMSRALWLGTGYDAKASKQRKDFGKITEQDAGRGVKYALWVPNKYNPKGEGYPLLLCIADEGRKPETHIMEDWVDGAIRDNCLIVSPIMPGNSGDWLGDSGVQAIMLTLRAARDNYAIDFNRIFIGGRGRGVETAHMVAQRFPDQFAGVFGWAGDANGEVDVRNFRNLPCYFAGGGPKATAFQEAANKAKIEHVTLQPDGKAADIWTWVQGVRRNPYPTSVSLVQMDFAPTNGYWLRIPRIDADGVSIDAKVDRATNTITLEGVGLDSAEILLNDALVDMTKPVTVIANGEETRFSETRKFSQSLELVKLSRNDAGRYFVATKVVRLPARSAAPAAGEGAGGDTK